MNCADRAQAFFGRCRSSESPRHRRRRFGELMEALAQLEKELQGELPASANLRDEFEGGARANGEEHLPDDASTRW